MFKRDAFNEETFPTLNYDNDFLNKRESITKCKCEEIESKVRKQKLIFKEKECKIKLLGNKNNNQFNKERKKLTLNVKEILK